MGPVASMPIEAGDQRRFLGDKRCFVVRFPGAPWNNGQLLERNSWNLLGGEQPIPGQLVIMKYRVREDEEGVEYVEGHHESEQR